MKKKKDETQVLLGHKHSWTDTAGHAHRVVFDEKALEKPRTTWLVLTVVTVVALAAGAFGVFTAPRHADSVSAFHFADSGLSFTFKNTIKHAAETPCCAIASGWNDEFFVADARGVSLYDAEGNKLGAWPNEPDETPTALAFVSDENAATNGTLLVAYGNKIKSLRFSLDNVVPGEGESVIFTAQNGALGDLELILTAPDADIRGLASSSERLFVADFQSGRVWRYSWKKIEALKHETKKETVPDCVIGDSDVASAYPGLKPAIKENFSISYLPGENELFVSNSGLFRVDAFNASVGTARSDHSWSRSGEMNESFTGAANPIAVAASREWLAVAEAGMSSSSETDEKASPVRFFNLNGESLGRLPYKGLERAEETFVVGIAVSPDSTRVYALNSNGDVDVWTSAR
ncbi:MAG: hypothetical protein J6X44_12215 [Thermoguttaceae bacterium]|nr:hypothetical protein [Thermoguttaceae bacterium]